MRDPRWWRSFESKLNELEEAGMNYDEAAPLATEHADGLEDDWADMERKRRKEERDEY